MSKKRIPKSKSKQPLDWQVESLRFTGFLSPGRQIEAETWWADLFSGSPEKDSKLPRIGGRQQEGRVQIPPIAGDMKVILSLRPERIDWVFAVADEPDEQERPPPTFSPLAEGIDALRHVSAKWFHYGTCPTFSRLAFGAVLLAPAASREEAYKRLLRMIPVRVDPTKASDLFYQINRRRKARKGVAGLEVNRLSKWSAALITHGVLQFDPKAVRMHSVDETHACRLELDINTAPEFTQQLAAEEASHVFEMLLDFGGEIAEKGDIA